MTLSIHGLTESLGGLRWFLISGTLVVENEERERNSVGQANQVLTED